MLSIVFGERHASLMCDNDGFSGQQWAEDFSLGAPSNSSACSHHSLSGSLHTCIQSQGVQSSTLLKCLSFQQQKAHPFLFSSPSLWQKRDIRGMPLAHSKSLRKRHQLWHLPQSSLGLNFIGHGLQHAPLPQLLQTSTGVTGIWVSAVSVPGHEPVSMAVAVIGEVKVAGLSQCLKKSTLWDSQEGDTWRFNKC